MISLRSIFGYAIGVIPVAADVRKISAYALTVDPSLAAVRKVDAYALVADAKQLPKGKSSLELIYGLINNNTSVAVYDTTTLTVTGPFVEQYQGHNSKIKVAATEQTRGYSGEAFLRYNRVSIANAFEVNAPVGFEVLEASTKHALLAAINAAHNVKISPSEIVDGPVKAGAKSISLTATDSSFIYLPGSKVTVGSSLINLDDIITVTQLPGFERVTMELSEAIAVDKLPGFDPVTE